MVCWARITGHIYTCVVESCHRIVVLLYLFTYVIVSLLAAVLPGCGTMAQSVSQAVKSNVCVCLNVNVNVNVNVNLCVVQHKKSFHRAKESHSHV